ncbi:MAG: TonB-dependent receptor [Firmicutes bacterium]|nr:TonB-dependent receptor [Bacillota bacterium]
MPLIAAGLTCCLLTGHVNAPSGRPLGGARVVVRGTVTRSAVTGAAGTFAVRVVPGRYDLDARAKGYVPTSVGPFPVRRSERIEVTLEPLDAPQLRVIGSVRVDGRLQPVRDAIPTVNVTRAQLQRAGMARVVDGLNLVPSVTFARPDGGSSSTFSTVALRGPDPSETLVALDGQILNDGNTGDLDLSRFPVADFSNLSVVEGLGPFDEEGSNTIGGAVDLVSLQPTRLPHDAFSASDGSFGRSELWYNATGSRGKFGYAFGLDDQQERGYVNQDVVLCTGGFDRAKAQPCAGPVPAHLGSAVAARSLLANMRYDFSQRADVGLRIFTLADARDQSGAVNTPADPNAEGAGAYFVGPGSSNIAQHIRAYDLHGRAALGAGSLIAVASVSNDDLELLGGGISPYDISHRDKRQTLSLSWERYLSDAELAFGGYVRGESLSEAGVAGVQSQSIASYFARAGIHPTRNLRLQAGIYASHYSTFGSNLDGRFGASYDVDPRTVVRFAAGTGFRAPLLIERYVFPVSALPLDQNCVATGQGNPAERPEHATEYELGYSHTYASDANLNVSLYRTNLRDPIETFYPLGARCPAANPPPVSYPINVGNVVYQGAEIRYVRNFRDLQVTARYGLNVAYPLDLPASVSNPTSGGNLVANQQFLNIPQQVASLQLNWMQGAWHAALDTVMRGKNNELNQGPYATVDAAAGREFGRTDVTLAATNLTNAVAGKFTLPGLGAPYRGVVGVGGSGAPLYGSLPTDAFFVEPLGLRLIVTVRG